MISARADRLTLEPLIELWDGPYPFSTTNKEKISSQTAVSCSISSTLALCSRVSKLARYNFNGFEIFLKEEWNATIQAELEIS